MSAPQTEQEYWESVAAATIVGGRLLDNYYKRQQLTRLVFGTEIIHKRILEIGAGMALTAAAVQSAIVGNWHYTALDVSRTYVEFIQDKLGLEARIGSITDLGEPSRSVDAIWLFDVLEHISPRRRTQAYCEMNRVLKNGGVIVVNTPLSESKHQEMYDFGFCEADLEFMNSQTGCFLKKNETYSCPEIGRTYLFTISEKR